MTPKRRIGNYELTDADRQRGHDQPSVSKQVQAALEHFELSRRDLEQLLPDVAPGSIANELLRARQAGRIISVAAPDEANQQGRWGARRYRAVRDE